MAIYNIEQLENLITLKEINNVREFLNHCKWNYKIPGGFLTNYPQRLVNTFGNGMKINNKGELYGNSWDSTFWTVKQTQNNVTLKTETSVMPDSFCKIIPKIRNYVKNLYPEANMDDNSFCVAVCNNYIDSNMTITAHKDDQEWYPHTIGRYPIFVSLTFYPNGKPIKDCYYSRFQIKKNNKWENIKLEDNSIMLLNADTFHRVLKHKEKDKKYFKQRINVTLRCLFDIKLNPLMNYISIANHSRYYKKPLEVLGNIIENDNIKNILEKYNDFCIMNNYDKINYKYIKHRKNKKDIVNIYKNYIKKYNLLDVKIKCNIVIEALEDVCKYILENFHK